MDAGILLWIQDNLRNDFLTPIMRSVTFLGEGGWFWILLTFLLFGQYLGSVPSSFDIFLYHL